MIGPNTDTDDAVEAALAPFDESLDVEPFRIHLDHKEILLMANHYNVSPANLQELATHMPAWRSGEGGVDREGLFRLSTCNPDGRWDWYEIGGRWDGNIPYSRSNVIRAGTLARSKHLEKCLLDYVVTPSGQWLEHERFYPTSEWRTVDKESLPESEWLGIVRETLLRWPDYRVVCVDIHC